MPQKIKTKQGALLVIFLWCATWPLLGQIVTDADVENALQQADTNRVSLETLLEQYAHDEEKLEAARYLIAHMVWHRQSGRVLNYDTRMDTLRHEIDSIYYSMIAGRPASVVYSNPTFRKQLSKVDQAFRKHAESTLLNEPCVEVVDLPDIKTIDGDFLKRQIEHAFRLRHEIKQVRSLSKNDFFRYILPYRAMADYPIVETNDTYAPYYRKYLRVESGDSLSTIIRRYNLTTRRRRYFGGRYPFETLTGFPELFYLGMTDCTPLSNYGALALRACGVPAITEFNIAYKLWNGAHQHTAVMDANGLWYTFSPESGLPKRRDPRFREALNLYRIQFDRQPGNPYSLRAEGEPIPDGLAHPCLEDATRHTMTAFTLKLPIPLQTTHNLAYLASFRSRDGGLTPVTWGQIDHKRGLAVFQNVVPDNLYFPIIFQADGEFISAGAPFLIISEEDSFRIEYPIQHDRKTVMADLRRKFPSKPRLQQLAKETIGTFVIGSNDKNFTRADTLGKIAQMPAPEWGNLRLTVTQPYRYYRVCSPPSHPHINLAEIQFLTERKLKYDNTIEATWDTPTDAPDSVRYVRLLDEPLEKCRWRKEYDGDVTTAPYKWPNVTLRLKSPQWVTCLRYVVRHADNQVKRNHRYRLYKWGQDGWTSCWKGVAKHSHIHLRLETGTLYWLHDETDGREELPFVITETGSQHFLHTPLLPRIMN